MQQVLEHLNDWHQRQGATIREIDSNGVILRYGSNSVEEINALLETCGAFDQRARWLLSVTGPDTATYLQGLVTQDAVAQEVGTLLPALICETKGKIQHRVELLRASANEFWVSCEPGEGVAVGRLLDQFHIREDVTFSLKSKTHFRVDLVGPQAPEVAHALDGTATWFSGTWGSRPLRVAVVPLESGLAFLEALQAHPQAQWVGEEAWEQVRIHEGLPRFGVEYGAGQFAQEAGLGEHISYTKGCYIGQEPNARMYHRGRPNWQLSGVKLPLTLRPELPTPLLHEGEACGEIRSLSEVDDGGFHRGIAWVRLAVAESLPSLTLATHPDQPISSFPLPHRITRHS